MHLMQIDPLKLPKKEAGLHVVMIIENSSWSWQSGALRQKFKFSHFMIMTLVVTIRHDHDTDGD